MSLPNLLLARCARATAFVLMFLGLAANGVWAGSSSLSSGQFEGGLSLAVAPQDSPPSNWRRAGKHDPVHWVYSGSTRASRSSGMSIEVRSRLRSGGV